MATKTKKKVCPICKKAVHSYGPNERYGSPVEEAAYLAACNVLGQVS